MTGTASTAPQAERPNVRNAYSVVSGNPSDMDQQAGAKRGRHTDDSPEVGRQLGHQRVGGEVIDRSVKRRVDRVGTPVVGDDRGERHVKTEILHRLVFPAQKHPGADAERGRKREEGERRETVRARIVVGVEASEDRREPHSARAGSVPSGRRIQPFRRRGALKAMIALSLGRSRESGTQASRTLPVPELLIGSSAEVAPRLPDSPGAPLSTIACHRFVDAGKAEGNPC